MYFCVIWMVNLVLSWKYHTNNRRSPQRCEILCTRVIFLYHRLRPIRIYFLLYYIVFAMRHNLQWSIAKKVIYCIALRYMIKQSIWFHMSTSARGAMYIDINIDMIRLLINNNIQAASWRNGQRVCLVCERTRDRIPQWARIFHFEILACFACRTARQCNCKWNQPWHTPS